MRKVSWTPRPSGQTRYLATTERRRLASGTLPAFPAPFLFPGGEDDIFRDPFSDCDPSSR